MEKNKISIIVPMYNAERFIKQNIETILSQKYKNYEIIIIDDGSIDSSVNVILENFKEEIENKKIILIMQNNFGAPAARNKGIDIATGEFMMFLDADDFLSKNAFEILINKANELHADIVIGNVTDVDEETGIPIDGSERHLTYDEFKEDEKLFNLLVNPLPCGKLFKSQIIKDNKIYFDNVRIGQDLNFYAKYIPFAEKVSIINDKVGNYRIVKNSISRTYTYTKIFDIVESLSKVEKFYKEHNISEEFIKKLKILKMLHYSKQLGKIVYFKNPLDRMTISHYFWKNLKLLNINYKDYNKLTQKFIKRKYLGFIKKSSTVFYIYKRIKMKIK